jgi:hypothetical protein
MLSIEANKKITCVSANPTDPNILEYVSGNTCIFFLGLNNQTVSEHEVMSE